MGIVLYLDPITINCRKVLSGLDLMQVPYETKHVDFFKGEQKAAEYTKINPMATIPAAVDGDLVLTESNSILQYAADQAKDDSFYPKDLKKRADVNRWLLWEASSWFGVNYTYLIQNVVVPHLFKGEPDQKVLEEEAPKFEKAAATLDQRLANSKFLCGDNVTIADIAVAAPMHMHQYQKSPFDKYPNIQRWIKEIEKIPAWNGRQKAVENALMPGHSTSNGTNGATNGTTNGSVRSTINYTKDLGDKLTELYFYETEKSKGIHEPGDDPHEMSFHDGWSKAKEFHEDVNGFAVKDFKTDYNDWEDGETVRSKFYPEIVEFLKRETGAKRILVFDHTIRTAANNAKKLTDQSNTSQRSPVMLVHCDYTAESGPLRVRQLLPDEAEDLLSRRVAFINVWKPLNVVEERPLAMCDVDSAPSSDFFKLYLRYNDRTGENYVMRHADRHKWWYFPKMRPDQCILLKTYESDESKARFVGHTAFEDPTSAKDAPMRESVEIRTIAFF